MADGVERVSGTVDMSSLIEFRGMGSCKLVECLMILMIFENFVCDCPKPPSVKQRGTVFGLE